MNLVWKHTFKQNKKSCSFICALTLNVERSFICDIKVVWRWSVISLHLNATPTPPSLQLPLPITATPTPSSLQFQLPLPHYYNSHSPITATPTPPLLQLPLPHHCNPPSLFWIIFALLVLVTLAALFVKMLNIL